MSEAATAEQVKTPELPDCGHTEWTLGCEKCFHEMRALAQDHLGEAQALQENGALMFGWWVTSVISNLEAQCMEEMQTSLDLKTQGTLRDLQENFKQLGLKIAKVMAVRPQMMAAMAQGQEIGRIIQERVTKKQAEEKAGPGAAKPKGSGIVITG